MSDTNYTKRELDLLFKNRDERFTSLKDSIAEGFKDVCERMNTHNTNTLSRLDAIDTKLGIQNGRTRKLESWRSWMTGGMAVFIPCVVFVAAWFFQAITVEIPKSVKDSIETRVDAELDGYKLVSEPPVRATFINATIASTTDHD